MRDRTPKVCYIATMEKMRKLELVQRSLAIRHKLKVHESMKQPDTHEDLAIMLLAKWELEDELRAIEELLLSMRQENVDEKRKIINNEDNPVMKKKKKY